MSEIDKTFNLSDYTSFKQTRTPSNNSNIHETYKLVCLGAEKRKCGKLSECNLLNIEARPVRTVRRDADFGRQNYFLLFNKLFCVCYMQE